MATARGGDVRRAGDGGARGRRPLRRAAAPVHRMRCSPRCPSAAPGNARLATIPGVVPGLYDRPAGCLFAPRCAYATRRCIAEPSVAAPVGAGERSLPLPDGRPCPRRRADARRSGRAGRSMSAQPLVREATARSGRHASGRSTRHHAHLRDPPRGVSPAGALAGGRRRLVRRRGRAHAGDRGRVGLRQVDARPRRRAARAAQRGHARAERRRRGARVAEGEASVAPLGADGVPESLRFAQPAQEGRRDSRGAARDQHGPRAGRARGAREGDACPGRPAPRALRPLSAHVLGRAAPAHRDRAGADARTRRWSSPTSRCPRSTCRCRRRC